MMTKQSLRKQADSVSERFYRLNIDFLTMYGILMFEFDDGINVQSETNKVMSMIERTTRQAKQDLSKIYRQQYKDNGFKGKVTLNYPSMYKDLRRNVGVTFTENGKKVFVPLKDVFKRLNETDQKDFERLAKQVADSGLRIQNGEFTYRLDNMARYTTIQGIKDINMKVQDILYEEMGADGWEIDYHANPRPSHEYMGGKQFVVGKAREINGMYFESFEEIALPRLIEPNCLHFKIPIICGVTKPLYTDRQLAEWRKEDQARFKYNERTYTKYEATQVQRRLEEEILRCNDRIVIAQSGGFDYMRRIEQSKRDVLWTEYKKFSKASGLEMKKLKH